MTDKTSTPDEPLPRGADRRDPRKREYDGEERRKGERRKTPPA